MVQHVVRFLLAVPADCVRAIQSLTSYFDSTDVNSKHSHEDCGGNPLDERPLVGEESLRLHPAPETQEASKRGNKQAQQHSVGSQQQIRKSRVVSLQRQTCRPDIQRTCVLTEYMQ